jgi:DNA-binding HxlR family transcriptional regulator
VSPAGFNVLKRELEGISQKVLSQTLKALERDGLVRREAFPTVPVTVEYSLTTLGHSLAALAATLESWVKQNMDAVVAARTLYDRASKQGAAPQVVTWSRR